MAELLRRGSSKDIWSVDGEPGQLEFVFSNRVSVFDVGPIPVEFEGLGQLRCAISGKIFQILEGAGANTHYIYHRGDKMRVYSAAIPEKNFLSTGHGGRRVLPVEILFRYEITAKLLRRIESGSVDRSSVEVWLSGGNNLKVGARFDPAFVECSTKWQDSDEYISDAAAAELSKVSLEELKHIYRDCRKAASVLRNFFRQAGFDLRDGKFEILRPFCFADSISPDEVRLVGQDGKNYDKEPVRRWYETNQPEWKNRLDWAKVTYPDDRAMWPSYEAIPPKEVIDEQLRLYETVAKAIAAA